MSPEQAVKEITSEYKWYFNDHYPKSTALDIVKRFKEKRITTGKLEEFLNKFGYVYREGEWIKTKMQQPNYKTK